MSRAAREETLFFDKKRETMSSETRRRELEAGLLKIIAHAHGHSRAYRDIWDRAGVEPREILGLDDLPKLPGVHLADLVERKKSDPPLGGFETIPVSDFHRIYANPGPIWQPGEKEYRDQSWAEGLVGAGFRPGDRILNTFNYHLWPFAMMLDDSARMIGATVIPTGVGNTLIQIKALQGLRVNGFFGTPSFLNTLIQRAESLGLDARRDFFLERALTGAEMLPEKLRARLEDKIDVTIRQTYGVVFLGCLGYECLHLSGLHVPSGVIVEVVDPQTGIPVPPGAVGEIAATSFNYSYPMIRFATGDLSYFIPESCPCGRTGPLLGRVLGRLDQATKVRGTFVHPWQTDEVMSKFKEVFKYQAVVTRDKDKDVMTFMVELKEDVPRPERLAGLMEREIKELLTVKGAVQIIPRGTIPDFQKKIVDRRPWEAAPE
ncbi:MAG: AMP-binding protein [Pseudomonadota bacterium]